MPVDGPPIRNPAHAEYTRRLGELRAEQSANQQRHEQLGIAKMIVAIVAVVFFIAGVAARHISLWILIPVAIFVLLEAMHGRVMQNLRRCSRLRAFYERGISRLDNTWMGTGETGERFLDPAHLYARDLDLFGKGSLFELLCTARTRAGEQALAGWLLRPAEAEEICTRQVAIVELRERLDLREDLAVLGESVRVGIQPDALVAWAESKPLFTSAGERAAATALAVLWVLSLGAWAAWGWILAPLASSAVNAWFWQPYGNRKREFIKPLEDAARDVGLLAEVLARLEREKFSSPKLNGLQKQLATNNVVASRAVARLRKLVDSLESRRNPFLKGIDPFVFWTLQLSFALSGWQKKYGSSLRAYVTAAGEMEALLALAGYHYENPEDVFAEFTEDAPCFDAQGFAHPLIPADRAVRNDLKLDRELQLMIISGPNMAGKSTFVRAVGTNAVLALCGAPVRARRLRISRLAVCASICILDSLQGGMSHFYAEIARLKQITDAASGTAPVLFLLDELLQGTNSHDRRIGAAAVVKSLVARGAIGMVTTHDLALTQIADSLGTQAANVHFEDRLEDGKLLFDYRLSPGIVQTSNALDLMRSIGLEV
jgi:hypothetical protein